MSESLYWPLVALVVLNVVAVGLWLLTLRLRFVLSMGPRSVATAPRSETEQEKRASAVDSVERQLVEDIRRWRAAGATTAAEPGLEHWIAEVERDERQADTGGFLPRGRRDRAGRAGFRGTKHRWNALASVARGLSGPFEDPLAREHENR